MKAKLLYCCIAILVLSFAVVPVFAQPSVSSDNYEITWPNLNMGAGLPSSDNYNLGVTTGQLAPGLYSSAGYKVRAGFQYIHSIIPFYFKLSDVSIDFGTLTLNVLTNEQTLTLTVNSGSAGGYQVTAQENDPLTSPADSTIPDTTCDTGDTCTHIDAGTWTDNTTYGFGYSMSGDDVPSEFSGGNFKNFADVPGDAAQKVMGKTPAEGHQAEKGKEATMTLRINIGSTQAAGTYQNYITFIATPTF